MPIRAYAFDAYGTLFDVHAAVGRHRAAIGPDADALSALWRAKQLEYSWVLTLAGRYRDFWTLRGRRWMSRCSAFHPSTRRCASLCSSLTASSTLTLTSRLRF